MPKTTALYEQHQKLGATFVNFADWLMPLHYGSQINEHHHVRNEAGVFDVSHMAVLDVRGVQAKAFMRYLVANDIQKIQENRALYTCMLNNEGGVKDDLIVYCLTEQYYRLVVNAAMQEKDLNWMREKAHPYNVEVEWQRDLSILAVQGPCAWERAREAFRIVDVKPFHFALIDDWMIAYTGYTGEAGMEIILPQTQVVALWQKLIEHGIKPVGLGARDSLRLEAGFNLYGHDMDESTSPLESNLAWTIDLKDKTREFIGRQALEQQLAHGVALQLVGLRLLDKGVCRAGMKVRANNQQGVLTSGGFSPTLSCGIALARLPKGDYDSVEVVIRDKQVPAKIIKLPFVKKSRS